MNRVVSSSLSGIRSALQRRTKTQPSMFPAASAMLLPSEISAPSTSSTRVDTPADSATGPFIATLHTGSASNATSFAEVSKDVYTVGQSTNIKWHESKLSKEERRKLMNQKGCVVWMTGLSGSGKSTLAYTVEHALASMGKFCVVLDGDNIRHGLNKNLGFSASDREENIRRVGEVAKLFADAGFITIVSFISPYKKDRYAARKLLDEGEFFEIYMKIPLSVCESRDPKGLYKKAREGKLKGFTGIDDPYEEPVNPEVVIEVSKEDGVLRSPEYMARQLIFYFNEMGILTGN